MQPLKVSLARLTALQSKRYGSVKFMEVKAMDEVTDSKLNKREKLALHLILFAVSILVRTKYSYQVSKPLDAIKALLDE